MNNQSIPHFFFEAFVEITERDLSEDEKAFISRNLREDKPRPARTVVTSPTERAVIEARKRGLRDSSTIDPQTAIDCGYDPDSLFEWGELCGAEILPLGMPELGEVILISPSHGFFVSYSIGLFQFLGSNWKEAQRTLNSGQKQVIIVNPMKLEYHPIQGSLQVPTFSEMYDQQGNYLVPYESVQ